MGSEIKSEQITRPWPHRQYPWNSDSFETFSMYAIPPKNMRFLL
jgi:hypothetical protein